MRTLPGSIVLTDRMERHAKKASAIHTRPDDLGANAFALSGPATESLFSSKA
jgi:hypothetical protein